MANQIKGKCKYCGKEYTRSYMLRHLGTCEKRRERLSAETAPDKTVGYYELEITGKYNKNYWLIIEISENSTLDTLDYFLRDIWVECCGHLSDFNIDGIRYEAHPEEDFGWDEPSHSTRTRLKKVLNVGTVFTYQYDFGSTTTLTLTARGYRKGARQKDAVTILSRNNPPVFMCTECGRNPATALCVECLWDGEKVFLCDECAEEHIHEDMLMNVCNSPRMGVCGYGGSEIYPDQFEPDV